jgi:hypothetical protein
MQLTNNMLPSLTVAPTRTKTTALVQHTKLHASSMVTQSEDEQHALHWDISYHLAPKATPHPGAAGAQGCAGRHIKPNPMAKNAYTIHVMVTCQVTMTCMTTHQQHFQTGDSTTQQASA